MSDRREAILSAARARFARDGYDRATIRGIAADAGVDPALVMHYFGSKQRLLVEALSLPVDPSELIPPLLGELDDRVGERVTRFFLELFEDPATRLPVAGLLRSGLSSDEGLPLLREFVHEVLVPTAAPRLGPDGDLRATLVGSQLVGLFLHRFVLAVEPLASADVDTLVAAYGPTIQRYLLGDLAGASA